ncbi:MAG: 50S ribosomal protein L21 [Christensenellaceae bacterium]|nr:50S ribosomal protein L21 [Christensenellaceae bacterium]
MYAIINCSGKQEKVVVGDKLKIESITAGVGTIVEFTVALIGKEDGIILGDAVQNSKVTAEVLYHGKGKKIVVYTYKAKKNVRRKKGHRQGYTEILIKDIIA